MFAALKGTRTSLSGLKKGGQRASRQTLGTNGDSIVNARSSSGRVFAVGMGIVHPSDAVSQERRVGSYFPTTATRPMIDPDTIFRALAHPFRRQVLQWLADPLQYFPENQRFPFQGVSMGMLHAKSGMSQSTVSSHVAQLERAGLLYAHKVGQWVFLTRNEDAIREFAERLCVDLLETER